MEAEKDHRIFYQKAKESVTQKKDLALKNVWVCNVCGHTHDADNPPDKCPVCNVGADKFSKF
jgi:rubrerythrin